MNRNTITGHHDPDDDKKRSTTKRSGTDSGSMTIVTYIKYVDVTEPEQSAAAEVPPSYFDRFLNKGDTSIPEEGVYAPPRPRKVLASEVVEFRTDQLPRRKPRITNDDSFLTVIDDE